MVCWGDDIDGSTSGVPKDTTFVQVRVASRHIPTASHDVARNHPRRGGGEQMSRSCTRTGLRDPTRKRWANHDPPQRPPRRTCPMLPAAASSDQAPQSSQDLQGRPRYPSTSLSLARSISPLV